MAARASTARRRRSVSTPTRFCSRPATRRRRSTACAATARSDALPVDPVFLELAPERRPADPERLGGAGVVAPEALERLQDVRALGLRERRLLGQRRRRAELQAR